MSSDYYRIESFIVLSRDTIYEFNLTLKISGILIGCGRRLDLRFRYMEWDFCIEFGDLIKIWDV